MFGVAKLSLKAVLTAHCDMGKLLADLKRIFEKSDDQDVAGLYEMYLGAKETQRALVKSYNKAQASLGDTRKGMKGSNRGVTSEMETPLGP